MPLITTNDTAFEVDVLKSSKPVVVDLDETVVVAKVNIDDNPLTPTRYGVRGIPTLMLFRNGEIAATKVGAMPKTKLYEWVDESLEGHTSAA